MIREPMLRGLEMIAVLDNLDEGIVVASRDGAAHHWNRAAIMLHGLASKDDVPTPAQFGERYRFSTLDGRPLPAPQWPLERILSGEIVDSTELLVSRVAGGWSRVLSYRGALVHAVQGGRDLAMMLITDVSERDAGRRSLAREEQRQELLLEAARTLVGAARIDGPEVVTLHERVVAHLDADRMFHGRLRRAQSLIETVVIIGVPPEVAASRPTLGLDDSLAGRIARSNQAVVLDAAELAADPHGAASLSAGGRAYYGQPLRARDGRVLGTLSYLRSRADSFNDGEVRFLQTFSHLVATAMERIDAEAALSERDTQLRLVLAQAPVILWSTDCDLRLVWAGGLALTRVGVDPAAVVGRRIIELFPERILPAGRQAKALAGEIVEFEGEFVGLIMRAVIVPLRDDTGAVIGTVGVAVDVTANHAAERAMRQANAELEDRVTVRTSELRAANAELESFAYAVAHDLRAPLRAVAGFTRAVLEDYGPHLPAAGQDMLGDVIAAAHTMGDLIDGLLALSRLTRAELVHDPLDLSAMAHDLVRELRRGEPDRQVAVTIEAGLHARGDRRLVAALLRNLLQNAWKYTGRTPAATIAVRREVRDGVPGFAVVDNGAGFSMEHAGKLFLPFQRLHRQDEFPGIGIGLATSLRIVRRHGGTIVGTGAPGAGACLWFTLPPTTDPEAA